jgi:hypothetical protein
VQLLVVISSKWAKRRASLRVKTKNLRTNRVAPRSQASETKDKEPIAL